MVLAKTQPEKVRGKPEPTTDTPMAHSIHPDGPLQGSGLSTCAAHRDCHKVARVLLSPPVSHQMLKIFERGTCFFSVTRV